MPHGRVAATLCYILDHVLERLGCGPELAVETLTGHIEQDFSAGQVHGDSSDQHRQEPHSTNYSCILLGGLWGRALG